MTRLVLATEFRMASSSKGMMKRRSMTSTEAFGHGAGAEFAARIAEKAFDYLDAPVKRVAALDVPTPYSPPLEAAALPDKARVLAAARELLRY